MTKNTSTSANDVKQPSTTITEPPTRNASQIPYRILKEATCPKLSPRAKGDLTYNIGYREDEMAYYFRVTANGSSGFFSNEWIALKAIQDVLEQQPKDKPFKAIVLKGLYVRKGANNHGFLAAALKAEKILVPVKDQPLLHTIADQFAEQLDKAMQKLIAQGVDLPDTVAIEQQKKLEKQAARIEQSKRDAESRQKSAGTDQASNAKITS